MDSNISTYNFGINLLKSLNKPLENLSISPISIYIALALTANGALETTQTEILSTLEPFSNLDINSINMKCQNILSLILKENSFGHNSIQIANAVMSVEQPKEEFIKLALAQFEAFSTKLESVEQVNNWCNEKTKGKISKLLDSINGISIIILNAVYFLGQWATKFEKTNTVDGKFFRGNNTEKNVQFMKTKFKKAHYYQDSTVQLIRLPYKESGFSADIILPTEDVNSYISKLNTDVIKRFDEVSKVDVWLELPKFEIEYGCALKQVLISLGMNAPFTINANFENFSEVKLFIDDVHHKTYMKVDENGTEAAAVTAVIMTRCFVMFEQMVVNRPFLFAIKHEKLDNYLFVSKLEDI